MWENVEGKTDSYDEYSVCVPQYHRRLRPLIRILGLKDTMYYRLSVPNGEKPTRDNMRLERRELLKFISPK